jgi:hypothetical protein
MSVMGQDGPWVAPLTRAHLSRWIGVGGVWLMTLSGAVALVIAARFGGADTPGSDLVYLAAGVDALAFASVGAILSVRLPHNRVGLVMRTGALMLVLTFLGYTVGAALTLERGPNDALAGLLTLLGGVGIFPTLVVAGALTALVFPDGHLPGPRWRWPVCAIAMAVAVGSLLIVVRPGSIGDGLANNPLGVDGVPLLTAIEPFAEVAYGIGTVAALVLALAATVGRFHRSRGVERQQLKWFAAASAAFIVLLAGSLTDGSSQTTVLEVLSVFSLSLPPIAIGIAVLRYRLYDIDRIISRTLAYAVMTAILAIVFAAVIVGLQALFANVTGTNTLAVAASTLVVASLFQPLRQRIQSLVDRRFNRAGYDAERTVAGFAARLRDEVDIATVTTDLHGTVLSAVHPSSLGLWIREARP